MRQVNPRVIPRNYLVEEALTDYLEHGELSKFKTLLNALKNPYESNPTDSQVQQPPPEAFDASYTTYCNT